MDNETKRDHEDKEVPLKDVVLSNSWALQAILNYLEETNPGARERIWEHYLGIKQGVEAKSKQSEKPESTSPPDEKG